MKFIKAESDSERISGIRYEIAGKSFVIKWNWPPDIDFVYVIKEEGNTFQDNIDFSKGYLYTRAEYKEFGGYCESISEIKNYRVTIFPGKKLQQEIFVINEVSSENSIIFCTGKPSIYYKIKDKRILFSKTKTVAITIVTDIDISKSLLCYVKKKGIPPLNKEDGLVYDFPMDFLAGTTEVGDISVDKDEYIKIFFSDGKKCGEKYNLIQL